MPKIINASLAIGDLASEQDTLSALCGKRVIRLPLLCICRNCKPPYFEIAKDYREMDTKTNLHDGKHETPKWEMGRISREDYEAFKRNFAMKQKGRPRLLRRLRQIFP